MGGPSDRSKGAGAFVRVWCAAHPQAGQPQAHLLRMPARPCAAPDGLVPRLTPVVPVCSEWDKMHREDIALVQAIRATPMAEELFLVSSILDNMFHLGDGPAILRRAAAEVGVSALRNGRMPGGTHSSGL